MTRDVDWCCFLDEVLEQACARDWQPIEASERRRESKCEDEPVQLSSSIDMSTPELRLGPDPDVEPDVGGQHG